MLQRGNSFLGTLCVGRKRELPLLRTGHYQPGDKLGAAPALFLCVLIGE